MKKLLALIIALSLALSLAACRREEQPAVDPENENVETDAPASNTDDVSGSPADEEASDAGVETEDAKKEEKAPEKAPGAEKKPVSSPKPSMNPEQSKPADTQQPAQLTEKPAETPAEKPAEPAPSPEPIPENSTKPSGETVGETLAAVWRANSGKSAEEIANAVLSHSSIQFMGGVLPVEEGLLTGFDNTEIRGFSSGYMFAPAIGTIPFVGYVFELSDASGADAFVSSLKGAANPRWNICTEAEQTIVEKSGNKVFFLMCPKTFEE